MRRWAAFLPTHILRAGKERTGVLKCLMPTFARGKHQSPAGVFYTQRSTSRFPFLNTMLFISSRFNADSNTRVRQLSDAVSRDGQIHLIDENGRNAGLISFNEAKLLADEKGLQLHLTRPVSHQHPHALYKLISKKDLYGMKKKRRLQQQNVVKNRPKVKELSFSTDIGEQDLHWKLERIQEFLMENDKVKLIINRKRRSKKDCNEFLNMVLDQIKEFGETEGKITETEFRMQCILKPSTQMKKN